MDFLKQKEELENKIKNINQYWDDVKTKNEEKLNKERELRKKAMKPHLYTSTNQLLNLLNYYNLISKYRYDKYILSFYSKDYDTEEKYFENDFLLLFYHLFKKIRIENETFNNNTEEATIKFYNYKNTNKHIFIEFFEQTKEKKYIHVYDKKTDSKSELDEHVEEFNQKKRNTDYFISEYEQYLKREEQRIEEENTEEYKQKRELEKLNEELERAKRVDSILKKILYY